MCGVVSLVYGKNNPRLGKESAALLKKLEYRGYDSTGAAFFAEDGSIRLLKKVGSPTKVIQELEIEKNQGCKFIGQVRWATYGAVTDENAQPHEMSCRLHICGAHNGNISNTDTLKDFLIERRHTVLSDNDGEMLVHVVEHFYADLIAERPPKSNDDKIVLFKEAIRRTQQKVHGSYAACISMPDIPGVFAMKAGSSLYAGKGSDAAGDFIVVSSDLTSVLSRTRFLIPLSEGEAMYFTDRDYTVFSLHDAREHVPALTRSRLNIADISLNSKYAFFMHQEIYSASRNLDGILKYYFDEDQERETFGVFEEHEALSSTIVFELLKLYEIFDKNSLRQSMEELFESREFQTIETALRERSIDLQPEGSYPRFTSDEAQLLRELLEFGEDLSSRLMLLDMIVVWKKKRKVTQYRRKLIHMLVETTKTGGRVFLVGAGTSYHAALTAGYFFNNVGGLAVIPANPGLFRSVFLRGLRTGDIIIGVTQSGETKDLLDIYNDVRALPDCAVHIVSIVNNENSTIPQEKSDFYLPIMCGPEIAVAATKSFISQIAIFYMLALSTKLPDEEVAKRLRQVQYLIDMTLKNVEDEVSEVSLKLFLKPSIHLLGTSLIGLAREGALKIREVVLNHTEGYDSAEFKHGPNTILGNNTIFSMSDMEHLLIDMCRFFKDLNEQTPGQGDESKRAWTDSCIDMVKALRFNNEATGEPASTETCFDLFRSHVSLERYFTNYPLIFICPPDERDRRITITQIHTHKIRGADIILIAQDDEELRRAVEGKPASLENYYTKYIRIPKLFDSSMFVFGATVVLQLLAFQMSVAKMRYLNRNHVEKHGVHPDVPKNVSKSITVD